MSIKFRGCLGIFFLGAMGFLLLNCGNSSKPSGLLLATSQGSTDVNSFGINLTTGMITQINTAAPVPANSVPSAITLDPTGSFAYVVNAATVSGSAGNVSTYHVNANGTLSSIGNSATGVNPVALTIDHAGHFLFVANQGSNNVSVFAIGSNAGLTFVGSFPTGTPPVPPSTAASNPASVAVTPSGGFLYVANQGQDTVSVFSINLTTGALTAVGSPFTSGTAPAGVTLDPSGKYLYVANSGSNNVSAFTICASLLPGCASANGSLVPVTGSPFSAGLGPVSLAVDPTGNFLYVADLNSNQLSGYRINVSNGALTPLSQPTVSTGTNPVVVAIHPAGNYLYVANIGSDTISGFHLVTQSGVLGPLTPVSTASRPAGIALK